MELADKLPTIQYMAQNLKYCKKRGRLTTFFRSVIFIPVCIVFLCLRKPQNRPLEHIIWHVVPYFLW